MLAEQAGSWWPQKLVFIPPKAAQGSWRDAAYGAQAYVLHSSFGGTTENTRKASFVGTTSQSGMLAFGSSSPTPDPCPQPGLWLSDGVCLPCMSWYGQENTLNSSPASSFPLCQPL